jgi:hypothetical protein
MSRPPERASLETLATWLKENVLASTLLTRNYTVFDLIEDLERIDNDGFMDSIDGLGEDA